MYNVNSNQNNWLLRSQKQYSSCMSLWKKLAFILILDMGLETL